jgi:hypothetical protein
MDRGPVTSCRIACIVSDPETGRGYWCESCPELGSGEPQSQGAATNGRVSVRAEQPFERDNEAVAQKCATPGVAAPGVTSEACVGGPA